MEAEYYRESERRMSGLIQTWGAAESIRHSHIDKNGRRIDYDERELLRPNLDDDSRNGDTYLLATGGNGTDVRITVKERVGYGTYGDSESFLVDRKDEKLHHEAIVEEYCDMHGCECEPLDEYLNRCELSKTILAVRDNNVSDTTGDAELNALADRCVKTAAMSGLVIPDGWRDAAVRYLTTFRTILRRQELAKYCSIRSWGSHTGNGEGCSLPAISKGCKYPWVTGVLSHDRIPETDCDVAYKVGLSDGSTITAHYDGNGDIMWGDNVIAKNEFNALFEQFEEYSAREKAARESTRTP
ncbi:MAG: hypothetical protein ACYC69_02630 [Thermodesulfovibrionales bacterium]